MLEVSVSELLKHVTLRGGDGWLDGRCCLSTSLGLLSWKAAGWPLVRAVPFLSRPKNALGEHCPAQGAEGAVSLPAPVGSPRCPAHSWAPGQTPMGQIPSGSMAVFGYPKPPKPGFWTRWWSDWIFKAPFSFYSRVHKLNRISDGPA